MSSPLVIARISELLGIDLVLIGVHVVEKVHQRIQCGVVQVKEEVLDVFHALLQFFFRKMMAGLA